VAVWLAGRRGGQLQPAAAMAGGINREMLPSAGLAWLAKAGWLAGAIFIGWLAAKLAGPYRRSPALAALPKKTAINEWRISKRRQWPWRRLQPAAGWRLAASIKLLAWLCQLSYCNGCLSIQ